MELQSRTIKARQTWRSTRWLACFSRPYAANHLTDPADDETSRKLVAVRSVQTRLAARVAFAGERFLNCFVELKAECGPRPLGRPDRLASLHHF